MMTRAAFACAIIAVAAASLQGSVRRVNYDESKVGEYRLEDPLVRLDGSRLANAADWPARRREILSVLEREEYGRWPQDPETKEGVVLAFRRPESPCDRVRIPLKGLPDGATVEVEDIDSGERRTLSDAVLEIVLPERRSSAIFTYRCKGEE